MALDIAVLDWFPSQVVVHLNHKDGSRPTFILGAVLPWEEQQSGEWFEFSELIYILDPSMIFVCVR